MRKRYLLIGSLTFLQFLANAQNHRDSIPEKVNKTEIELVYNHYVQDGNNSAVTGGRGTEKLIVYGPMLTINKINNKKSLGFNMGADIISSASTDRINFVMSSASVLDTRYYLNTKYGNTIGNKGFSMYGGAGVSFESDYFSLGGRVELIKEDEKRLRTYTAQLQAFHDDLRWGRSHKTPLKLIYPVELRFKEWYDVHKRNSFNLKLGLTQVINKRNIMGIFPELTYQNGLLSTPFHRIIFIDDTKAVEQLPEIRFKGSLGLKLNTFVAGRFIVKNFINGYTDTWGINAVSFENETAVKLSYQLSLLPGFRLYHQSGSPYFAEYGQHKTTDTYFTSDFDLNRFNSFNIGLGIKYTPFKYKVEALPFNTLVFRCNYFHTTNDLQALIFSIAFLKEFDKR